MYKPLEDYISSLSPQEREQHKDLIEDCLKRSRRTKENINKIREDIKTLSDSWEELRVRQENLLDSLTKLNSNIIDLYLFISSEVFVQSIKSQPGEHIRSMN